MLHPRGKIHTFAQKAKKKLRLLFQGLLLKLKLTKTNAKVLKN